MVERYSVEMRAAISGDVLEGHAAVFDQMADLGRHYETIERRALDGALRDVRAFFNHDDSLLLGRQSTGTLRLGVDSQGLAFEIDLPDTQTGRDVRALVERGDLDGASFAFLKGVEKWSKAADGRSLRTHVSIREVIDVSPVTLPAYEGAGVRLRSLNLETLDQRTQLIRARMAAMEGVK